MIDPLIYSFPDPDVKDGAKPKGKKKSKSRAKEPENSNINDTYNGIGSGSGSGSAMGGIGGSSVPPSAQKSYPTGWTPLISKTIFNDQLISFSPNNKWGSTLQQHAQGSGSDLVDYTQGLSLTPFLNHNLQAGFGAGSSTGMTPYHDKTLHLADFFMDSPIRQTPMKDLDTITPSKFRIQSVERKKSVKQLLFQNSTTTTSTPMRDSKRSITQVDTPPRQPYKLSNLSITANADKEDDIDNEHEEDDDDDDDVDNEKGSQNGDDEDDEDENDDDDDDNDDNYEEEDAENSNNKKAYINTPSRRGLSDISNTKTPLRQKSTNTTTHITNSFQTPHQPISASSPSTVIMSSTNKSPERSNVRRLNIPPSPTPTKELKPAPCKKIIDGDGFKPAMGVFSEKKNPKKSTNNNNNNNNKNNFSIKDNNNNLGNNLGGSKGVPGGTGIKGKSSKAQQAGMNKFQIVFTDVHTLMNGKTAKEKEKKEKRKKNPTLNQNQKHNQIMNQSLNVQVKTPAQPTFSQTSASEISLLSIQNNSMNTSHLNMSSTDHSSFELGTSSTPNSKFFLDKMFEKPSPSGKQLQQQFLQLQQQQHQLQQQQQHIQQNQQGQFPYFSMQQQMYNPMPPPIGGRDHNNSSNNKEELAIQ